MKNNILISTLLLPLFACSSDGGNSTPPTNSTKTGVFLDSPVINIGYRTETIEGITNSLGEFNYLQEENITFFIGDLTLPPTQATEVVTPLDLANTQDTSNSTVVNIIRLLQTLDKNGNPDDGITITNSAISAATPVDFSLDEGSFESSPAVANLIPNITDLETPVLTLISTEDAISNFEKSLDDAVSMNMTQKTASSVMTFSECPGKPFGWDYTFTKTSVTLTGSDGWGAECIPNKRESFTVNNMAALARDFDIPFKCAAYPVCKSADFNRTASGTDEDGDIFKSTYRFNRRTNVLTTVKQVGGVKFTEVITIR